MSSRRFIMYTDLEVTKMVRSMLGLLYSKGYTKYQISIELNVNEKSIYKWEHGTTPKANYYLNLKLLCEKAECISY